MKINKEKFLEALDQLENHQNNQENNNLEEAKKALEQIIRKIEQLLRESNSEFEEWLLNSGINFENIFEEIEEFSSLQEVEKKEQEIFLNFFTFYYFSLVEENPISNNSEREIEGLISLLEIFQQREIFPLSNIYQENQEKIEDTIGTLKAIILSFGEPVETKEVIPSSSKGKEVERNSSPIEINNQFLLETALKKVNKDNIIDLQKIIIKEKDEEIGEQKEEIQRLKQELAAEKEKVAKLSAELEKLLGEKPEFKTEVLPKKV